MSLFRYPGSKARMLGDVRRYLDPILADAHVFVDLFVGGGAVSLDVASRYPDVGLIMNDADQGIADVWQILAFKRNQGCEELKQMLREAKPSLELREDILKGYWRPITRVERAFHALYLNHTGFSGILHGGPMGGLSQKNYTIDCRWNPDRLCDEIDATHSLLRGRCDVRCEDATTFLQGLVGEANVVGYADPPYYAVGNQLYRHGMSVEDHARLARSLDGKRNWLLSYDDVPEVRALYAERGHRWRVGTRYSVAATRRPRRELLIAPHSHPLTPTARRRVADVHAAIDEILAEVKRRAA